MALSFSLRAAVASVGVTSNRVSVALRAQRLGPAMSLSMARDCQGSGSGSVSGRQQRQLWGGRRIVFGERRAEDKKSPIKSPRRWEPNVVPKTFKSEVLGRNISTKVTTRVMRCIDKAGGFDRYILNTRDKDLDSAFGVRLKQEMVKVLRQQEAADK
eukprot:m.355914 g.355914  ORF g.355914 m.355914 type:complete len:157 (-) comp17386_c0_seq1:770-1240(-)